MKKIDIIQTTILVIAILNAYTLVEFLLSTLSSISLAFYPYSGGVGDVIVKLIITLAVIGGVYLLIRYSRRIALWLLKADPEGDTQGEARWNVDRRTLVFALFIGIGLFMFSDATVYAIRDFYDLFKEKVASHTIMAPPKTNYLVLELLRVTIGALLIYASPTLTDFIEKKIAVRMKIPATEAISPETSDPEDPPDTADGEPYTQAS